MTGNNVDAPGNVIADKYVKISDKVKVQGDEDEPVIIPKGMQV